MHQCLLVFTGTTGGIDPEVWGTVHMRVLLCRGFQCWLGVPALEHQAPCSLDTVEAVVARRLPALAETVK